MTPFHGLRTAPWRALLGDSKRASFQKSKAPEESSRINWLKKTEAHGTALLDSSASQRNYLYYTKHNIVEPTRCHQKHKYAKHVFFLHSTAFNLLTCPTQQPFLTRLISLRNTTKEPERGLSHERANGPFAYRSPELGIPTVD